MTAWAAEKDEIHDLYRELILDHARRPRHFGRLEQATHRAQGINPLCGDKLSFYFVVDARGRIADASFEGSGCAISVASASLLADEVIGLQVTQAKALFDAVTSRLTRGETLNRNDLDANFETRYEKLVALDGVREFPSRVKCATLAWHALQSALNGQSAPATTE